MKLGKRLGRIGFLIGFVCPLISYAGPTSLLNDSCPWCPHIDALRVSPLTWIDIGLRFGLFSGLSFAVMGFVVGCTLSRLPFSPWHYWTPERGGRPE